jgi:hypothetical protein
MIGVFDSGHSRANHHVIGCPLALTAEHSRRNPESRMKPEQRTRN